MWIIVIETQFNIACAIFVADKVLAALEGNFLFSSHSFLFCVWRKMLIRVAMVLSLALVKRVFLCSQTASVGLTTVQMGRTHNCDNIRWNTTIWRWTAEVATEKSRDWANKFRHLCWNQRRSASQCKTTPPTLRVVGYFFSRSLVYFSLKVPCTKCSRNERMYPTSARSPEQKITNGSIWHFSYFSINI